MKWKRKKQRKHLTGEADGSNSSWTSEERKTRGLVAPGSFSNHCGGKHKIIHIITYQTDQSRVSGIPLYRRPLKWYRPGTLGRKHCSFIFFLEIFSICHLNLSPILVCLAMLIPTLKINLPNTDQHLRCEKFAPKILMTMALILVSTKKTLNFDSHIKSGFTNFKSPFKIRKMGLKNTNNAGANFNSRVKISH